ncbi:cell division inhibitor SepF [Hydrogenispora ethanolica]|jgi:cell division inhibitor SepF|uniref:Cell division protein SepF n=1 Tax=Hydrogenispora ethanolica TaxID=1082276 RepID=A0A4V2QEZ5_HYDET|nr:cell division protein SepF [Hydrogenispora ethanolica]TCL69937.1 cell division inhibitor SepF [Hydrogenispora ethanolica]
MAKWDQEEDKYNPHTKKGLFEKFLNTFGFEAEDIVEEPETAATVEPRPVRRDSRERGKLVSLNNPSSNNANNSNNNSAGTQAKPVRLVIVEPTSFEEVQALVDHLKNKRAVIINLEETEKVLARRIADFMGGAIYALEGTMQRVSGSIFLFSPQHIEVSVPPKSEWRDKEKDWPAGPGGGAGTTYRNDRER